MLSSILDSTKKILNIDYSYTAFDQEITTHINSVFSTLNQLGIGRPDGFFIEGSEETWDMFRAETVEGVEVVHVPNNQLNAVKTYIYLKVRMLFDPPSTSYLITAMENQIKEAEWRLSVFRENEIPLVTASTESEEVVW